MKAFQPSSEKLPYLLETIDNRDMALPDFQRDFVWEPKATDELIESIISNYPAGSLLRIQNGHKLFKPRAFKGADDLTPHSKPNFLVLDGQQRLTSLYQAFYGKGDYRFFINLSGLENNDDLEDCCFYLREKEASKRFSTIEQQAEKLIFPLKRLFGAPGGFDSWQNEILAFYSSQSTDVTQVLSLNQRLVSLRAKWIKPIEDYEFPVVTLHEDTSASAVCTIFETLNRTGVKLSVFDLLVSRFWPQDFNLRQKWQEAQEKNPILSEFEIDPYYVLQIVALLEPGKDKDGKLKAPSIKRGEVLAMSVEQARVQWDDAIRGLAKALTILHDDCGVLLPKLLPYATILIPMAAAWVKQAHVVGPQSGANKLKLMRWFWCSVFGQRYENSPNTQAERDFGELQSWMEDGSEPAPVREFQLNLDLRTISPRQRAVYRGIMALILRHHSLDFWTRDQITVQMLNDEDNPVDDHHIFPQAFLDQEGASSALRDCIVNRTFIDRKTNIRLSKTAPSIYFPEMRQTHGDAESDELLRSHFLPEGTPSPLTMDDFDTFLAFRETALLDEIKKVTS